MEQITPSVICPVWSRQTFASICQATTPTPHKRQNARGTHLRSRPSRPIRRSRIRLRLCCLLGTSSIRRTSQNLSSIPAGSINTISQTPSKILSQQTFLDPQTPAHQNETAWQGHSSCQARSVFRPTFPPPEPPPDQQRPIHTQPLCLQNSFWPTKPHQVPFHRPMQPDLDIPRLSEIHRTLIQDWGHNRATPGWHPPGCGQGNGTVVFGRFPQILALTRRLRSLIRCEPT
ncbi:hypothetical protein FA15DRAFT_628839, partial [Coprinopsis marcescibilis]